MASFTTFLVVYLLGGLTFLPLVVVLAIYLTTKPVAAPPTDCSNPESTKTKSTESTDRTDTKDGQSGEGDIFQGLALPGDDVRALETARHDHAQSRARARAGKGRKAHRSQTDDFSTAGYFAVHRKYVAMGVDSRPIEPGTVGPAPVAPPSPSVYQTFFRSMLKKPGADGDAVDTSSAASPRPRNARNMFYVVLRHGHLILFDDDQQVDVRHVIKLADHDVQIYSGGGPTPEGELFIKRNAIRLAPRARAPVPAAHNAPAPKPWFFYCDNCSEKEDFYFALVRSQDRAPRAQDIEVRHLTALMERLHASEEAAEMRWLNALVGRLFLGVHKTPDVLRFVQAKIVTKIARTPRPSFVSSLVVQRVAIGETTPQILSPRLKSMTADGEVVVEADVRYTGRFEIDIAATLRVSTPLGPQEVKTSLAVVLTHLEGHVLLKVKAPPSNRVWFSFRHMPKIDFEIRPIIMARQLTWPVFLQIIENKIKEALAESIVLPFWDDTPFFSTETKPWRGGIWADEAANAPDNAPANGAANGAANAAANAAASAADDDNASPAVLRLRRLSKAHSNATTATLGSLPTASTTSLDSASDWSGPPTKPKKSRKNKLSQDVSDLIGGMGGITTPKLSSRGSTLSVPGEHAASTTAASSWLSAGTLRGDRSDVSLAGGEPHSGVASASRPVSSDGPTETPLDDAGAGVATGAEQREGANDVVPHATRPATRPATFAGSPSASLASLHGKPVDRAATVGLTPETDAHGNPKTSAMLASAVTGAAQSAKRWGMSALQRRTTALAERRARAELEQRKGSAAHPLDLSKPMGGGMPLPPLGEPLPRPSEIPRRESVSVASVKSGASVTSVASAVSVASVASVPDPAESDDAKARVTQTIKRKDVPSHAAAPTETARRRRQNTNGSSARGSVPDTEPQGLLIVEAPVESDDDAQADDARADGVPTPPLPPRSASASAQPELVLPEDDAAAHDTAHDTAHDDEHWGELAESVITAFLEDGSEAGSHRQQASHIEDDGTLHLPEHNTPLITLDDKDTASPRSH